MKTFYSLFFFFFACLSRVPAQEVVAPLKVNAAYLHPAPAHHSPKTRGTLPFLDDFSYQGPYPDASLWTDSGAYINNTMSATPITRGMATLDGLNKVGRPYFEQPFNAGLSDSLTSTSINLSSYTPASNIYLSFFYQPQGLGFAPETSDSLFLFFRNKSNQWVRIWQTKGTPLQPFRPVVLPVTDTNYLHANFQFRFVNIASLNTNDDVWNLDYIYLDANRFAADSLFNDIAFTTEPGSILKNYTSMPYRHFLVNPSNELSTTQDLEIRNLYSTPQTISVNLNAEESISSAVLNTQSLPSVIVPGKGVMAQSALSYPISFPSPGLQSPVHIRNTYFYSPVNSLDRKSNDTISRDIIFDNYFAYDDGSAEKSYYLLGATNFPSKTALQFTLAQPDTLRGLMLHFGPQLPSAAGKFFSMVLYKSLGSGTVSDSIILQEDLFTVQYVPDYNGFSSYAFHAPPVLDAGTYYIGITQPANFGSDTIYYGLDVNTNSSLQHLSYNVDGTWYSSTVNGSVMMRPIVGPAFIATTVQNINDPLANLSLYPNPVSDKAYISGIENEILTCSIFSIDGRLEGQLAIDSDHSISLKQACSGLHMLVFSDKKGHHTNKKIVKL